MRFISKVLHQAVDKNNDDAKQIKLCFGENDWIDVGAETDGATAFCVRGC